MRKALAGFTFLLLLISAGPARAQKSNGPGEFKELIQRYWQAWSTLNPDNAAPMYSKDADAVFFDISPLKYNGWEEYKQGVQKVFATAASASFAANDDLKATRRGNIAWTASTFHGTVTRKTASHGFGRAPHGCLGKARGALGHCP